MIHPIKPMLCGWENAPADGSPFVPKAGITYELKWDGYRMIAVKQGDDVLLYMRSGNFATKEYPEIVESLRAIPFDVVLDGEILVMRNGSPNFNDLQNRMGLSKERRAADLRFMAYDVLQLGAVDTVAARSPYSDRRQALEKIVELAGPAITIGESSTDGAAMWAKVVANKLEGLIAKPLNARYVYGESGRSVWTKIKRMVEEDFTLIGWAEGSGKRANSIGSLLIAEPATDGNGLRGAGAVGSFAVTTDILDGLVQRFAPLERSTIHPSVTSNAPKPTPGAPVHWMEPTLVVRVRYPDRSEGPNGVVKMSTYQHIVGEQPAPVATPKPQAIRPVVVGEPEPVKANGSIKMGQRYTGTLSPGMSFEAPGSTGIRYVIVKGGDDLQYLGCTGPCGRFLFKGSKYTPCKHISAVLSDQLAGRTLAESGFVQ